MENCGSSFISPHCLSSLFSEKTYSKARSMSGVITSFCDGDGAHSLQYEPYKIQHTLP
jgi:hypothetical protein